MNIPRTAIISLGLISTAAAGNLHTGMTEGEVLRLYGKPSQISESDSDLQWIYIERGGIGFMNPFHNPKVTSMTFHKGRVAHYTVDE